MAVLPNFNVDEAAALGRLMRFLAVEGVKRFQRQLETLSKLSWAAVIDLT